MEVSARVYGPHLGLHSRQSATPQGSHQETLCEPGLEWPTTHSGVKRPPAGCGKRAQPSAAWQNLTVTVYPGADALGGAHGGLPVYHGTGISDLGFSFRDETLPHEESATGLTLQLVKLTQDLGETRKKHLSSRGKLQDLQAFQADPSSQGEGFLVDVEAMKRDLGGEIASTWAEMRSHFLEIEEETSNSAAEAEWLTDVDQRMGALLRKMAAKLGGFERTVGHS